VTAGFDSVPTPILVGLGGAAGALARYTVDRLLDGGRRSTLAVNVLGSTLLGAVAAASLPPAALALAVAATGFCGAFTTFSSFALNVTRALDTGQVDIALADAVGTLAAALAGVWIGSLLVGL
jgi:CrcB protein